MVIINNIWPERSLQLKSMFDIGCDVLLQSRGYYFLTDLHGFTQSWNPNQYHISGWGTTESLPQHHEKNVPGGGHFHLHPGRIYQGTSSCIFWQHTRLTHIQEKIRIYITKVLLRTAVGNLEWYKKQRDLTTPNAILLTLLLFKSVIMYGQASKVDPMKIFLAKINDLGKERQEYLMASGYEDSESGYDIKIEIYQQTSLPRTRMTYFTTMEMFPCFYRRWWPITPRLCPPPIIAHWKAHVQVTMGREKPPNCKPIT